MSTINPTGVKQEKNLDQNNPQTNEKSNVGKVSSTVFKALSAQQARADELLREENRDFCTEQCTKKYFAKADKPCVTDCTSINVFHALISFGIPH